MEVQLSEPRSLFSDPDDFLDHYGEGELTFRRELREATRESSVGNAEISDVDVFRDWRLRVALGGNVASDEQIRAVRRAVSDVSGLSVESWLLECANR